MSSRRLSRSRRKWTGFGLLALLVVASTLAIVSYQRNLAGPQSADTVAAWKALSKDPFAADRGWVLAHMQFPPTWQNRLLSANDARAFEVALQEYIGQRVMIDAIGSLQQNNPSTIANYRAGRLQLGVSNSIPFSLPFNWAQSDQGANFLMELHSLRLLTNFIKEYEEGGDRLYIDVAAEIGLDWARKNPYGKALDPIAWHEGSVSKRVVVLSNMAMNYPALQPPLKMPLTTLLAMIHQHATYLTQQQTYVANGNHGITQDMGLLAAAKAFPEFTEAREWQLLALKRLREQQIGSGFSREGVWREHSPRYHHFVMNALSSLAPLLPEWDQADFLSQLQSKSDAYLTHVLTPMGRFPPVADSSESTISVKLAKAPSVLYVRSRGKNGRAPEQLDGFYPDAGEVIFRDTWGRPDRPADQAFYIHIHAACHPGFGHRHQDDLSFILHALGRWWILEAGKFTYDEGPMRNFIESPQAHNSITFNGAALDALDYDAPEKTARVEVDSVSTPQIAAARAHTNRFEPDDVHATRTYVFLRQRQTLVLLDDLQSPEPGNWQGYIHLAPDTVPELTGATITATAPTHPTMRLCMVTETEKTSTVRIARGQNDPILGWYSPDYRKIEPTPVVVYERTANRVVVATIIQLTDVTSPPPVDVHTRADGADHVVTWREGDESLSLSISNAAPLHVTLSNP